MLFPKLLVCRTKYTYDPAYDFFPPRRLCEGILVPLVRLEIVFHYLSRLDETLALILGPLPHPISDFKLVRHNSTV